MINEAAVNNQAPVNVGTPANSANEVSTGNKAAVKSLPDLRTVVAFIWFTGMIVYITYICIRYFDLKENEISGRIRLSLQGVESGAALIERALNAGILREETRGAGCARERFISINEPVKVDFSFQGQQ